MVINFNVGLLGHVDSGKTTLARALSSISSTAAFDKSPQSQERGITLDLGFSAALLETSADVHAVDGEKHEVQVTFVDCPGHASLIRTVIGGAQIIDLMILVIDCLKGIQTQTAECIVIGELLCKKLIVVVNKVDLLAGATANKVSLEKLHKNLRSTFAKTTFGRDVAIYDVAALTGEGTKMLLDGIRSHVYIPERNVNGPLLLYVDHCFSVKGQGTICTGTITQGTLNVRDVVEIAALREQRRVKSIQIFRRAVSQAVAGDRVGFCVTQFNAKLMERGLVSQAGYLQPIYAACISFRPIRFYKLAFRSNSKFHISLGHETVMAKITLFRNNTDGDSSEDRFDLHREYEYIDEVEVSDSSDLLPPIYALLQFETPILGPMDAKLIASRLDMEVHTNTCRLAFWGQIQWCTHSMNYANDDLPMLRIFKRKTKRGTIQRVLNPTEAIVKNLFRKGGNRNLLVGKEVLLSTGETGIIANCFGMNSKVKVHFPINLTTETMNMLQNNPRGHDLAVVLTYKKYIFNKKLETS